MNQSNSFSDIFKNITADLESGGGKNQIGGKLDGGKYYGESALGEHRDGNFYAPKAQ